MTKPSAALGLVLPFPNNSDNQDPGNFVGAHNTRDVGAHAPTNSPPTDRHSNPDKSRISLWPDTNVLADFKQYAHSNGLSYTEAFTLAAQLLMSAKPNGHTYVGARPPTLILDLDSEDLKPFIDLHFAWTAAYNATAPVSGQTRRPRWYPEDTVAVRKISHYDIRIIELGIIHTIAKIPPTSGPIRYFRYYIPEIHRLHTESQNLPNEQLGRLHEYQTDKMKRHLNVK